VVEGGALLNSELRTCAFGFRGQLGCTAACVLPTTMNAFETCRGSLRESLVRRSRQTRR
jgi:hypothetical protein